MKFVIKTNDIVEHHSVVINQSDRKNTQTHETIRRVLKNIITNYL